MADMGAQTNPSTQRRLEWQRLPVTLAVGGLVTTICLVIDL